MKKLILLGLLACLCLFTHAQIKVQLQHGSGYLTDIRQNQKVSIGDDKIKLYAYHDDGSYFDAIYKDIHCFVLYNDIVPSPSYNSYAEKWAKKTTEDKYKNNPYVLEYGKRWGVLVANKVIVIGMSKDMVLSALGEPKSQTVTDNGYGVTRLWEYEHKFVYFSDGKVSSITDF